MAVLAQWCWPNEPRWTEALPDTQGNKMIRITVIAQDPKEVVLKIEGRLEGEDVVLLAAEGEGHLLKTARLVLEITEVKFIDQAGIQLLQRWARKRLVLQGGAPFVQALLKEHGLA